jgi:DNA-binding CsgD family transcriptional regulator
MRRLRTADLEAILSFLEEAQTVDGPARFTTELLDLLTEIVGCVNATFSEVDHRGRTVPRFVRCSVDDWDGTDDDEWWESPRTVALNRYRLSERTGSEIVLSDFFSREQRASAEFNPNVLGGVTDEIQIDLDPARTWFAGLNVATDGNFGEREWEIMRRLHPHLIGLYRSAELRRRLETSAFDSDTAGQLTRREREFMLCVADGLSNTEIANPLVVAQGTVHKHLENIYKKLGVPSRTAALAKLTVAGRPRASAIAR